MNSFPPNNVSHGYFNPEDKNKFLFPQNQHVYNTEIPFRHFPNDNNLNHNAGYPNWQNNTAVSNQVDLNCQMLERLTLAGADIKDEEMEY